RSVEVRFARGETADIFTRGYQGLRFRVHGECRRRRYIQGPGRKGRRSLIHGQRDSDTRGRKNERQAPRRAGLALSKRRTAPRAPQELLAALRLRNGEAFERNAE